MKKTRSISRKLTRRSRSRSKSKTRRSRSRSKSKTRRSRSRSKSKTRRSRSSQNLTCKQELRQKVAINISEGKYTSTAQAVAVAYGQVRQARPGCKKILQNKM